ncbi:MAG: exopolyphosphatase [Flavobacteriales bacterium]|nr:exopolyphosphatase [Flavobacteriales bacterium]MCX7769354.1 exopolyphosphatase [Flavobacteriales bacterium]MDW8410715.1 exopolyphosphatase [Flavobacteriales bacterium]
MRLAAADIGSNAVRFIFYNIYETPEGPVFKKISVVRLPVRLGEEVFNTGVVSEAKTEALVKALKAFRLMAEVHGCTHVRVMATSAMREAENSLEIVQKVYYATGLEVEIIDGREEARYLFANVRDLKLSDKWDYLHVDVGGGSTELTLFNKKNVLFSGSYNIGTLRMLGGKNLDKEWKSLFEDLKKALRGRRTSLRIVGTGGNINKLHRLSGLKEGEPMKRKLLEAIFKMLKSLSYEERLVKLGLNHDRADVIIPAAEIFIRLAKELNVNTILVPKLGLSDGIIHAMYEEIKRTGKDRF